jgi:hypothetical protein
LKPRASKKGAISGIEQPLRNIYTELSRQFHTSPAYPPHQRDSYRETHEVSPAYELFF